jgi:hypothetical protein
MFSIEGLRSAVVFVTYHTPVPADFANPHSQHLSFLGLGRHATTWAHLGRMLERATADLDDKLHARALVSAYIGYLEKHGMATDYPEYKDVASLA